MIGIVKGLWGDSSLVRRNVQPPAAFELVKQDIRKASEVKENLSRVYSFGGPNTDFLRQIGYNPIQLSHRSWAHPTRPNKRYNLRFKWNGALHSGYSYWWHKFKIIETALKEFPDGVLWCDFDVVQKRDVTPILEDLRTGPPLRASLYLQGNWTWGAGWRHKSEWDVPGTSIHTESDSHDAARIILGCGFFYVRDVDIIRQCFEIQDEFPHFLDHQVLTLLFDRMHGGTWIGEEAYMKRGWHTRGYYYGRQLHPPRFKDIYFQAGPRQRRVRP